MVGRHGASGSHTHGTQHRATIIDLFISPSTMASDPADKSPHLAALEGSGSAG